MTPNTYLTPDQLILDLRLEIKHLKREYELLARTATGALSIVIEQIETQRVRFKHDSSTTALEAPDARRSGMSNKDLPDGLAGTIASVGDERSVELCREVVGAIEYDPKAPDAR